MLTKATTIPKSKRLIIAIDASRCTGCRNCVDACLTGALKIVDGKSKLVNERLCDGFGSCIAACPNDAIKLEHRVAEGFDWSILNQIDFNALINKLRMTSMKIGHNSP
ncbi:MAG: ATP-binding protein [Candidatus Bathyarchaeia archaeon]